MTSAPAFKLYELERHLERDLVLEELRRVPGRLRDLVVGASRDELLHEPAPGDWSAFKTLCHMRDATLVYAARFRWIVFNDDPFLPDFDEDRWVAEALDNWGDTASIVGEIEASRTDLYRLLSRLPAEAWRRTGRHEVVGTVVLEDYLRHQLVHEEMHLAQIAAALG